MASGSATWTHPLNGQSRMGNHVASRLNHALLALVVVCHRATPPNLVAQCRDRLQITPNTHAKVPAVPSSRPPGLPPLVFADRPPTTPSKQLAHLSAERRPNPPRRIGREKTTVSVLASVGDSVEEGVRCLPSAIVIAQCVAGLLNLWAQSFHVVGEDANVVPRFGLATSQTREGWHNKHTLSKTRQMPWFASVSFPGDLDSAFATRCRRAQPLPFPFYGDAPNSSVWFGDGSQSGSHQLQCHIAWTPLLLSWEAERGSSGCDFSFSARNSCVREGEPLLHNSTHIAARCPRQAAAPPLHSSPQRNSSARSLLPHGKCCTLWEWHASSPLAKRAC